MGQMWDRLSNGLISSLDSNLGVILQNAGETWNERRIAYNTPPGTLKGKLMTEQI